MAEKPLPRLAVNKTEAARVLGVSVDFFDQYIAEELKCVYRGRRRLYPTTELERWLEQSAERGCGALALSPVAHLAMTKFCLVMGGLFHAL